MASRLLLALVAALMLAACSSGDPAPADPTPTISPTAPSPQPTGAPSEDAGAPIAASWAQGAASVGLPGGYDLVDCEGDAPLLCVEKDGEEVGLLMLSSFALPPELASAGDGDALSAALQDFAASANQSVVEDRAAGCGDGYAFEAGPTTAHTVGGHPGVRYGFTGTEAGQVTERVQSYATVAYDELWIVTVEGAAPGGCMGSDELLVFDPAVLESLLPTLDRVVAGAVFEPGAAGA